MKHLSLALFTAISMGHGAITNAQDSLIGTYFGTYEGPLIFRMKLVITSVEKGVVKGTATVFNGACQGTYPMEGTYDGNKLVMLDKGKGEHPDDCRFGFNTVHEGNKLVGKIGGPSWPIEMSK